MKTTFLKTAFSAAVISFATCAQATVHNDNGSAASYSLSNGDVLNINAGTFTGSITSFASGAVINVATGAIFKPTIIQGNAAGTWNVYGTITLNAAASQALNSSTASLKLNNWGVFSATDISVGSGAVMNAASGKLYINSLQFKGSFDNAGEVYIADAAVFSCNSCTFQNRTGGSLYASSLSLDINTINEGYIYSQGLLSKTGGSYLTNTCTMISSGGMTFGQGIITNNGFMIVLQGTFTNTTSFTNGVNAQVQGIDFTNGTATNTGNSIQLLGAGNFRFTGTTTHTANGSFGADGTLATHINFYDVSRSSLTQIVDNALKPIHSSVTYLPVVAIDTAVTKAYCNTAAIGTPLPVKLMDFTTQQAASNRAVVRWTVAEQVAVKHYEIEYSTNGHTYASKAVVLPQTSSGTINYKTELTLGPAAKHYFRLKMVNEDGSVEYSSIVVLNAAIGEADQFIIKVNPAYSQTIIELTGGQDKAVVVELLGSAGQVLLRKEVKTLASHSQVQLTGLERFLPGLYYVRVTGSNRTQTKKLILQ